MTLLSVRSLRRWCMFNVSVSFSLVSIIEVAPPRTVARAEQPGQERSTGRERNCACRSALDTELETELHTVESLIADGQKAVRGSG